ncbi:MAG: response regulator [Rubrivivax sp.]|nr:MAG: response regulator [Rubrivivax sp.]
MSAEFLPRVFDRFTQGDAASNVTKGGLGLGLAIIKQIVEAHAGRISVTSPGVGQGTTFTVELPVVQERRERDEDLDDGEAASAPLAGLEVLVVDDNEEASTVLAVVLSDRGAAVRAASDAEAALLLVRARRPDVLISDIGMPGKDGYALIREIRLSDAARGVSRLPAIALTAFARDEDRLQALEAGFDAHCAKPLRPLELVRQVVLLARKG